MFEFLDFGTLRLIWWALLGVLLMGFLIFDGFDLGVATLLPVIGRTDTERRILIRSVDPVWEGNQVWLILGAGASFAAWPYVYAVSFSGFYLAICLALFTIILRPVGFKFRSKLHSTTWRSIWDGVIFLGGFGPALVLGVAFGNVFTGAPFTFDETLRVHYSGDTLGLFTPFSLLCGVVSVAIVLFQGSTYLLMKTEAELFQRAKKTLVVSGLLLLIAFSVGGFLLQTSVEGYHLTSAMPWDGPSNPLHKEVIRELGSWLQIYEQHQWAWAFPLSVYGCVILGMIFGLASCSCLAFVFSSLSIVGILGTAGISLFPFLLPSSANPNHSLVIWDASSSHYTLLVMLISACIFLPIILAYTAWVYRVLRGVITPKTLEEKEEY
ncbi:MAG: cytochrome d ubiquinol oxidase subunit II [Alphaproteobacteria bacterium]